MDMTYSIMDKDGNVKTLPMFGDQHPYVFHAYEAPFRHEQTLMSKEQDIEAALSIEVQEETRDTEVANSDEGVLYYFAIVSTCSSDQPYQTHSSPGLQHFASVPLGYIPPQEGP